MAAASILGYVVSLPVNWIVNPEGTRMTWQHGGVDPRLLDHYRMTRDECVLVFVALGLLSSQAVFLVRHLKNEKPVA
jgi:hypothetical protein